MKYPPEKIALFNKLLLRFARNNLLKGIFLILFFIFYIYYNIYFYKSQMDASVSLTRNSRLSFVRYSVYDNPLAFFISLFKISMSSLFSRKNLLLYTPNRQHARRVFESWGKKPEGMRTQTQKPILFLADFCFYHGRELSEMTTDEGPAIINTERTVANCDCVVRFIVCS